MDKDGWKKTRKYRKNEKFGFKISAQNSSLPHVQSANCVYCPPWKCQGISSYMIVRDLCTRELDINKL